MQVEDAPAHGDSTLWTPRPTLAGADYTSDAVYDQERERVWWGDWVCVGRSEDLPVPGDYVVRDLAGDSIFITRNVDGALRAFYNVCRHRGMKVVGQACNSRTLSCPYHRWTYGLDGKLIGTPAIAGVNRNEAPEFEKELPGLVPVRSGQWFDFIFVNMDGKANPLDEH